MSIIHCSIESGSIRKAKGGPDIEPARDRGRGVPSNTEGLSRGPVLWPQPVGPGSEAFVKTFHTIGNIPADLAAARIVEGRDTTADPEAASGQKV